MGRERRFEVVVVGGGWGGLATAALLSSRSVRVLLLEAAGQLGGRSSFIEREGYVVDYGVHGHRFGSSGPVAKYYQELGEEFELLTPGEGLVFHEGAEYPAPDALSDFIRTRLASRGAKISAGMALAGILASRSREALYRRSVSEMLPSGIGEEALSLITFLAGAGLISPDLETTSAGEFAWFLRAAARSKESIAYPAGGCAQHIERLSRIVARHGEVGTGCPVDSVMVRNGRVEGVICRGDPIGCAAVVLTMPLPRAADLLPEGALPTAVEGRMRSIEPTAGISLDMGLRSKVSDAHSVAFTEPLMVGAFRSNTDPSLCPPSRQLATFFMPLPVSLMGDASYVEERQGELRKVVFGAFAGMEEKVEWERMLRMKVVDGARPSVSQPWPDRPTPDGAGLPGLFLAGDCVGVPGQAGDIAFGSALECAGAVQAFL